MWPSVNAKSLGIGALVAALLLSSSPVWAQKFVYVLELRADYIGPPTESQVEKIITMSEEDGAAAAVIVLDTPGGSVDSMFEIIRSIYASQVPVVIYIGPRGANAASAGAFITVASHIAAMSPGTAIGAAEPITGYDPSGSVQPAPNKTKSFIIGKMESTANLSGRPVDTCVEFITKNLVLTETEALQEGIVDFVAQNVSHLLSQIEDFEIHGALEDGSKPRVTLSDAEVEYIGLTISERFSNYMSNPTISYLLLLVGMYGIIFGFMDPGTYVPETIGAICIVLALFGLGIVGANIVGIILLILGMVFLVAEAATPTFGLFTAAAVACLVFGVLFLPPSWEGGVMPDFYMPRQWYTTFALTSLTVVAGLAAFFLVGLRYVVKGRKAPVRTGGDELVGRPGSAVTDLDPTGQVSVRGEIWKARSVEGDIPRKSEVEIVGRKGLTLTVRRRE